MTRSLRPRAPREAEEPEVSFAARPERTTLTATRVIPLATWEMLSASASPPAPPSQKETRATPTKMPGTRENSTSGSGR